MEFVGLCVDTEPQGRFESLPVPIIPSGGEIMNHKEDYESQRAQSYFHRGHREKTE